MEQSQSASDYKEYFLNKFISLFGELVDKSIYFLQNDNKNENSEQLENLIKIKNLVDKLNYDKIIKKMEENKKLIDILNLLSKNNSDEPTYLNFFKNKEKYWTIIPSFNINQVVLEISNRTNHIELFSIINNLHVCAITYNKVLEQISQCDKDGTSFNPFESIGNNVNTNIDIQTLFDGVEVKNISAYDMIMSQIINQETNNKMDEYMNNIKESDVDEATSTLNNVIESEKFNGNKQTAKLLSEMLYNIKDEVINLKSNTENKNMQGKQGVEQLLGIAQKVAGNMMGKIKDSEVSVLEIWDATSSLAKNTVQSDALNIVDNLIRSNIVSNINNQYNQQVKKEQEEQVKEEHQDKKTRRKKN